MAHGGEVDRPQELTGLGGDDEAVRMIRNIAKDIRRLDKLDAITSPGTLFSQSIQTWASGCQRL